MTQERGTFRQYGPQKDLRADTIQIIGVLNSIIDEYEARGYVMTVRQIYYQMVARGHTGGENSGRMYDRVQATLNVGRMQGLISWTALEDRGRGLRGLNHYSSVREVLRSARADFRHDLWADQQWRPEVWIEKDALVGVIGSICNKLRVDFFACRGYNSQSEQWRAGRRFASRLQHGQRPIVFHLGDHDPSGIDMTRDNRDRLSLFAGTSIMVQRLALNMPQVEEIRPPPNPAKITDSRAADYIARFGDESWELDALEPMYIERLIEQAILKIRDPEIWEQSLQLENEDLETLDILIERQS